VSAHTATVAWTRGASVHVDGKYNRAHTWRFDGGAVVPASSSPHVVRVPFSDPHGVDPEEAFVAALASCHMLCFLSLAAGRGHRVDLYVDTAEGTLGRTAEGRRWVAAVVLRPAVTFSGPRAPTQAEVDALHHAAHEECFIANSVRTQVSVAGSWQHTPEQA
jgi:organic hydroperoxide reductase OsmC/OhrA